MVSRQQDDGVRGMACGPRTSRGAHVRTEYSPGTSRRRGARPPHVALRGLAVCALWLATLPLRHSGSEARLGLDVVLALAGWWAVRPGRRQGGELFGEHGHWTSLVIALPVGFGIAAAVELWHLLRGAGA